MKISLHRLIICLIIVLLASCESQASNSTETTPPIEITSFPSTMSLNNIDLEFLGYDAHKFDLSIEICFDPPSEGDWFFGDITLKIGNQEFQESGVSRNPNPGRTDGFECETVTYYVTDQIIPSGKAELTIGRLGLIADIDERNCETAQKHLDEAETGIIVTCNPTVAGAFTVTKKPVLMSDEEAFLIASDAFSYSEAIPLDWKFSFLIEKQ